MDIIGLIIVTTLVKPDIIYETHHTKESIKTIIKKTSKIPGAISYILFI
jgi:hypothetical protein